MIYNKHILPLLMASAAIAMPFTSTAAPDVTAEEARIILGDTIPYGVQPMQAAFGYTETRDSYTGAQSSVDAESIDHWKGTSLEAAIKGKLAGWYNGKIRGESSPYASDPLIVLDGTPLPFMSLAELDPTSVEQVTILKDAAAKALYGPQGAQGVVIITTKHGNSASMKVNISANFGIEKATKQPELLNSYSQAMLRNQALVNDGLTPQFNETQLAAFRDGTGVDNNWQDKYMDDMFLQKYNIQVGAGSQRVRFYINLGFSREDGKVKATYKDKYNASDFTNRFTVVSNLDVDVTSWLRAFANTNVRVKRVNACRDGGAKVYEKIYSTPAWVPDGMLEDGSIITADGYSKPLFGMINYAGINQMTQTDLAANIGFDVDLKFITPGLSFKGLFGYSSNYNGIRGGTHDYRRVVWNENTEKYETWGQNVEEPLAWAKSTTTNYYIDIQAMFNYRRTFAEDHSVEALINYTAEDYRGGDPVWYTYAFILPSNRIQLAGMAKYGFKNRYFAEFDFNYSGSEMMKEGYQFHFSPTVSASWVASEESWLKNDILTYLKFRASYGELYYDSLRAQDSRYLYNNVYRAGTGGVGGIFSGYGIETLRRGTADICWEKSKQQNYGVDLGFWDKFHINFDYWRVNQESVLCQSEMIPSLGGITNENRPFSNTGEIFNHGVDLSLSYATVLPCGLEIVAAGQMGWNKNHWVAADELSYADAGYAYDYRKTGYSIGQQWGYLVDGSNGSIFWNSMDEINNSGLTFTGVQPRPGDLKYRDLNGDNVIDEGDYAPLSGAYQTPRFNYGASVNLAYKGFDLYLDFVGESGRSALFNSSLGVAEYVKDITVEGSYMPHHQTSWTAERLAEGLKIDYPALSTSASSSLQNNSFFTSKLDYLRMRNLTFGYSLPDKIISRMGMTKLRVYFAAQNLFTIDNMKFDGIDPEAKGSGTDVMANFNKVYRSFNFGLNINF